MFYKILVVDDDESVVEILATGLEKENLQIYKACDGETAFGIISDKKPHVVISDLVMPGLGGWQLFEQTRKTSPDTIFIFLTGYGSIPDATSSIKKGVFDYLEKPFSIQKIRNVLNSALEHYDTIQENNYLKQRLSSLKNRYIDLDMLLKHSSRIREVTDFASYLKEDTSKKDLLKKLLKAALEITRSKNGSIYLHDSKESKFSLELIESLAVAPELAVKNVPVDQTSLLSQHKSVSCNFSSSTETAAMPSPRQQDFTNSQETMTISIESGHRDWGVLYLLGKI
jgi:YesN/AraC family two-component response regulator